jgi:putative membrane protein
MSVSWDLPPSIALGIGLLGGLYVWGGGLRAGWRRVGAFAGASGALILALTGPLHEWSERYLFSAHMVQHLVLTMLFPPLLLYSLPAWTVRRVVRWRTALRAAAVLVRPLPAALLFGSVMVFWHLPAFYESAMRNHDLHIVQHLTLLAAAVLVWWPVLSPLPELPRLSYPGQMLYLFLAGLPMSMIGALIALAGTVRYAFYLDAPRIIPGLPPLADQQLGGLIMWIPGALILWAAMTVIWFRWSAREERGDVERAVPLEAYADSRGLPTRRPPSLPGGVV